MNRPLRKNKLDARDRDIIVDSDGRIFIVLGYIQPENRILSFLKYIPSQNGDWKTESTSYKRYFWGSVESVVDGMQLVPTEYITFDEHFGTELIEVPHDAVFQHLLPEERLSEICRSGPRDRLEEVVVKAVQEIQDALDIHLDDIGVAGSILWKGHNPKFSDVNMNVYGLENAQRLWTDFTSLDSGSPVIRVRAAHEWKRAAQRIHKRIPILPMRDIMTMLSKRKAVYIENQCVGITPVLHPDEAPVSYGSETYQQVSEVPTRLRFKITNAKYGIFYPAIYKGTSPSLNELGGLGIDRVMVYDGAFSGIFSEGDEVELCGTIQQVTPNDSRDLFFQVMIGTKLGAGQEYMRFL